MTHKPTCNSVYENPSGIAPGELACTCSPIPKSWQTRLMDEFCVMFERATREIEPVDWVERMEDFIENELSIAQSEAVEQERERLRVAIEDIIQKERFAGAPYALNNVLALLDSHK